MFITAQTLDDLLQKTFRKILSAGNPISSGKGDSKELIGVLLELKNPLARLSRTEVKGKVFSGLGELFWYLSGTSELEFIAYYVNEYRSGSDDGKTIHGGYGPRLFGNRAINQIENVLDLLSAPGDSRRAVVQLFNAEDLSKRYKDIPCTCTLQFMRRSGRLHMVTYMRSNDAFLGLPHDVFTFTMLQEMLARRLGLDLGKYSHAVGSLHLYNKHFDQAMTYMNEGWQSSESTLSMPQMPHGDPWSHLPKILQAEEAIRSGLSFGLVGSPLPTYWKDLVRLLQIFRCGKNGQPKDIRRISEIKRRMSSGVYDIYIDAFFARKRAIQKTPSTLPEQMHFSEVMQKPSRSQPKNM
jgi:thymidylate synthase